MNQRLFVLLLLLIAVWPVAAVPGITIVGATGSVSNSDSLLSYVSWTQANTWTNVSISASLYASAGTGTGVAYLTTKVGSGTTNANEVANTAISITGNTPQSLLLFSGLTLNPGTYYLVILPTVPSVSSESAVHPRLAVQPNLNWAWSSGSGVTITTGSGVTYNGTFQCFGCTFAPSYPPASTNFSSKGTNTSQWFNVAGALFTQTVPALSGFALLLTATLLGFSGWVILRRYSQA
jgi:hypothetical protein